MTPEQYKRIGELYHAAMERSPGERSSYLREACAGDEELERKVQALLAAHDQAGEFLAAPDKALLDGLRDDLKPIATFGQKFGQYEVVSLIGSGGMGEVYLAHDTRLDRPIALKLLPSKFMQDADRVHRFKQEARAASATNHPNIITIFDIGAAFGNEGIIHFIATEYIDGQTLRHRLLESPVTPREALDVVIQVASALASAHEAGIVHRDIKPENIMIRSDGYVKVLDFGLAKLTEQTSELQTGSDGQDNPTKSLFETQPGLVLGTVAYMSPEQARGIRVDGRTDIFSLGVVLYELIAGERPFSGGTTSDMIASLLMGEPKRLSQHLPNLPPELERIVSRMLVKDRDARSQTAREVVSDLKCVSARLQASGETRETLPLEPETARFEAGSAPASNSQSPQLNYATNVIEPAESAANYVTNISPGSPIAQSGAAIGGVKVGARRFLLPVLAFLAIALAGGFLAFRSVRRDAVIDSIAVLPFVNENNDPDAEYLSEGVAEGIINTLSQLPELSVASRNSVLRYKGKEADAQVVGRELGVKAVLLGRVERRGEDLTIKSELVNVRDGRQIWGERFTRKIINLMGVQEEITRNLAGKLRWRLTDPQKESLANFGTQDAEAYDLYLKGRYYWNQGTPEAMQKADEYFEAAAGKDPNYALAAAGCAACHAAGADGKKPQEGMQKAKFVALKALKVDPLLVDAHLTLAQVNLRYDWDFKSAETEFKRAIGLNPKHATAHLRYAEFLALMGRQQEALSQLNRARELDPRSPPINQAFGTLAYYQREYTDAIEHLRQVIQLNKDFAPAHTSLGLAYEQKGLTQDAVMEFLRARFLTHDNQENLTALKQAFASGGREVFWQTYLSQLIAESKERYVPASLIAAVQTRLGESEKAFAALDQAMTEKDGGLVELKVEPVFEPLRAQTKFNELLRRVGLP